MVDQVISKLVSYTNDEASDEKRAEYNVSHNNGNTTLTQELYITQSMSGKWRVSMSIDDLPMFDDPKEGVKKLAEWMTRMGHALENFDPDIEVK